MMEKLEALVGKKIEFFDVSGGCLDIQGKDVKDWWNLSDEIYLEKLINRNFFVRSSETKHLYRYKVKRILDIEGHYVTLEKRD